MSLITICIILVQVEQLISFMLHLKIYRKNLIINLQQI